MGAPSNFDPEEYGNNGEPVADMDASAVAIAAETPPAEVLAQDANLTTEEEI